MIPEAITKREFEKKLIAYETFCQNQTSLSGRFLSLFTTDAQADETYKEVQKIVTFVENHQVHITASNLKRLRTIIAGISHLQYPLFAEKIDAIYKKHYDPHSLLEISEAWEEGNFDKARAHLTQILQLRNEGIQERFWATIANHEALSSLLSDDSYQLKGIRELRFTVIPEYFNAEGLFNLLKFYALVITRCQNDLVHITFRTNFSGKLPAALMQAICRTPTLRFLDLSCFALEKQPELLAGLASHKSLKCLTCTSIPTLLPLSCRIHTPKSFDDLYPKRKVTIDNLKEITKLSKKVSQLSLAIEDNRKLAAAVKINTRSSVRTLTVQIDGVSRKVHPLTPLAPFLAAVNPEELCLVGSWKKHLTFQHPHMQVSLTREGDENKIQIIKDTSFFQFDNALYLKRLVLVDDTVIPPYEQDACGDFQFDDALLDYVSITATEDLDGNLQEAYLVDLAALK